MLRNFRRWFASARRLMHWEHPMDRDPRAKEQANLNDALSNFEHQLDLFEARVGYPPKDSQAPDLAPADPHTAAGNDPRIAFASNVVAAMKNRMSEDHAAAGMRDAVSPDSRW
ncbi:hypothetical protein [Bradyrhizobium sp. CB3481]|uniref:hypothetical protein n=1 Tax=Bradyrhizobium sp. CB3481 TaxID=3039158 RepID=UPI0024B1D254|nr:hypothetical protein [Bradyrhizobium sp. CB3481]WFU13756.1 hypothetical protein QA643_21185 [Bradyrhizobium sp. CB3481]